MTKWLIPSISLALILLTVSADRQITQMLAYTLSTAGSGLNKTLQLVKPLSTQNDGQFIPLWPWSSNDESSINLAVSQDNLKSARLQNPEQQSAKQLWLTWKSLLVQSQFQQIPIIGALLAKRLQEQTEPSVYAAISYLLGQKSLAAESKALLLDLLADIATPEALQLLLELTRNGQDSSLYYLVLAAIARIGDNRWNGQFHQELSPLLESAWNDANTTDPALINALATAIAKIGAPEGVNLLLLTLSGLEQYNQEIGRVKQEAAFNAVPQTRNPDSVGVLSEWLEQESIGSPGFEVSGAALGGIGTPESTQEIIDWAQDAPDEGARNLESWLSDVDDGKVKEALIDTSGNLKSFESTQVSEVVHKHTKLPHANDQTAFSTSSMLSNEAKAP